MHLTLSGPPHLLAFVHCPALLGCSASASSSVTLSRLSFCRPLMTPTVSRRPRLRRITASPSSSPLSSPPHSSIANDMLSSPTPSPSSQSQPQSQPQPQSQSHLSRIRTRATTALLPASTTAIKASLAPATTTTTTNTPTTTPTKTETDTTTHPALPSRLPSKWVVAITASVVHALHATAIYTAPSTLLSPMRQALGLSVAEITRPLFVYRLIQTCCLFPAGYVINLLGPQRVLRLSIIIAAVTAPLLAFVQNLNHLYVLNVVFALTKLFGGLSPLLLLTSHAFPDNNNNSNGKESNGSLKDDGAMKGEGKAKRQQFGMGTATAVVLSGYSFAGFLAPAAIGAMTQFMSWRAATLILTTLFAVVSLPLTLVVLRNRVAYPTLPQAWALIKTKVDEFYKRFNSRSTTTTTSHSQPSTAPISTTAQQQKQPLFTPAYACIFCCVAAFSFSMHIMFDHFILFLNEDLHIPFHVATRYMSALNLLSLFGKLMAGPISDHVQSKTLLICVYAVVAFFASLLLVQFSFIPSFMFTVTSNTMRITTFVVLCTFFPLPFCSHQ